MEPLFFILIALLIGVATRFFLEKTPLPYTVLLLVLGIGLGLLVRFNVFEHQNGAFFISLSASIKWAGDLNPQIILFVFLPILAFEASFGMDMHVFKKTAVNATILAVPGILVAILLTGLLIEGLDVAQIGFANWSWPMAFLFGAVISATDPVAVVAILKDLGVSKKLSTLIDAESLLNDGTAIVFFFVFAALLPFQLFETSNHGIVYQFIKVSLGGILLGLVVGATTLIWIKRVFNDALIEITLIVIAAYLTFYIAEHFIHVSGVLGLVALGLSMASAGRTRISPDVQQFLHEFWQLASFIANTLIFVIVGVVIAKKTVYTGSDFLALILLYIGIHVIRAAMILVFYPIMKKKGYGISVNDAIILGYSGLRGAVGLALALIFVGQVNARYSDNSALVNIGNQFLFYTAGIVVLTLLINATTIKIIIKKLKMNVMPFAKRAMFSKIVAGVYTKTHSEIDVLKSDRFMNGADWKMVKNYLPNSVSNHASLESLTQIDPLVEIRRRLLEKEKNSYWNQFREGLLAPLAYRKLTDNLNEVIDWGGAMPLSQRDYLTSFWRVSKFWNSLLSLPIIGRLNRRLLLEKLAVNYDAARSFVIAQEEVFKLSETLNDESEKSDALTKHNGSTIGLIQNEINENRIRGLAYISELHQQHPEIIKAIETRQAARSILNFEKNAIIKLQKEGKLEEDEATTLMLDSERRMKRLMESSIIASLPGPFEVLEHLSWLSNIDKATVEEVKSVAVLKNHNQGNVLFKETESPESGMLVVVRGSVKVIVQDKIIDILGTGSIIGEMSVLAGINRTATVIAHTPVTALWFSRKEINQLLSKQEELERRLWHMAGMRFAENMLGREKPYVDMAHVNLRRLLNNGVVIKTQSEGRLLTSNQVAVLLTGKAHNPETKQAYIAPVLIKEVETVFSESATVFVVSLSTL